jgi:hypothetical protein
MGSCISSFFQIPAYHGWRKDYKTDLDNMWCAKLNTYCGCIAQMCEVCNGAYITTCECAKKQFINSVSYEDLQTFLKTRVIMVR